MTVLSADRWATNGHLIEDVARLGYIGEHVLDLSYGRGLFWSRYKPAVLNSNDIDTSLETNYHLDATAYQWMWASSFDTVVWDGPYRLNGTPDRGDFDERYGISKRETWQDRMKLLLRGSYWGAMYVKPGGTLLVKCQDQVVSGRKVWQTLEIAERVAGFEGPHAMTLVDRFDMVRSPRPQPPGRRQVHSRSNTSTLLVFRRAR